MRPGQDPQLNLLLSTLAARLANAVSDSVLTGIEDVPDQNTSVVAAFVACGLLTPAEPARALVCDGCERGCVMPVETARRRTGMERFIVCDKRDDIGQVPVAADRLRRWIVSMESLVGALSKAFLCDPPTMPRDGEPWRLGTVGPGGIDVVFSKTSLTLPGSHLDIVLTEPEGASASPCVTLHHVLGFHNGVPRMRSDRLAEALSARFGASQKACEIIFERGSYG